MEQNIRKEIEQNLKEIEKQRGVQILLAVESGSRAWGFASPDSDYDVRFIYMRPAKDYLRLDSPRDVIEWQLDEVLDINGWDLKKALNPQNPVIADFISGELERQRTLAGQLPDDRNRDWTELNRVFLRLLHG